MPFFNGQRGPNQGSQQSNDEFSQRRQAYNEQRVDILSSNRFIQFFILASSPSGYIKP